jgi:hypothetical protein
MSGFHTATICADCDPPVVALSTGHGSRCPRCGQVVDAPITRDVEAILLRPIANGPLARKVILDTALRSDGDAWLLGELARRLLDLTGQIR